MENNIFEKNELNCKNQQKYQYKMLDIISFGTFGKVYKVLMNQGQFALKVLQKKELKPCILEYPEIKILNDLDHPNIIKLNQFWISSDTHQLNLIFPICTGGDIENLINTNKNIPQQIVLYILFQIISAIEYANIKQKIIHRDIKPSNILFNKQGENFKIFIIDWGSACYLNGTKLCQIAGTQNYCAPEVIKRNYDERSEVWSIGVIAHMLFTELIPFNIIENELDINQKNLSFQQNLWAHRSKQCLEITKQMLTYDPKKRICISDLFNSSLFMNFHSPQIEMQLSLNKSDISIEDPKIGIDSQIKFIKDIAEKLQLSQADMLSREFITLYQQTYDGILKYQNSSTLGQIIEQIKEQNKPKQGASKK